MTEPVKQIEATAESTWAAKEWMRSNDDGSGVGMTPEKVSSLAHLIDRCKIEAKIELCKDIERNRWSGIPPIGIMDWFLKLRAQLAEHDRKVSAHNATGKE